MPLNTSVIISIFGIIYILLCNIVLLHSYVHHIQSPNIFSSPQLPFKISPQTNKNLGRKHEMHLQSSMNYLLKTLNKLNDPISSPELNLTTIQGLGDAAYDVVTNFAGVLVTPFSNNDTRKTIPVVAALQRMQKDMDFLDDIASRTPQLTKLEFAILFSSVGISALSPALFSIKIVELIVPSMAALAASVGISAEYVGKVAVSNGKEITALAIQASAEAEAVLATAERSKAILPLCVGIATTASAFALLAPSILSELVETLSIQVVTQIYLVCPLISVLSASIAGLASSESRSLASSAAGVGNRRFASSKSVGTTWLSASEQVALQSKRANDKWREFAIGVCAAPVASVLFPGTIGVKSIVCTAIATAQAAYYLSIAEYAISDAVDAVALKTRTAAIADTYTSQGSRAGSILPFTSALAGLSAAASAAVVETLPLIQNFPQLQCLIAMVFPFSAALFGAAASVSKARCEVNIFIIIFLFIDFITANLGGRISIDGSCCNSISNK